MPRPAAWILQQQAAHHRRVHAVKAAVRVCAALSLLVLLLVHVQPAMGLQPPDVPASEEICGSSILDGPSSPPGGSVTVPAGDNSGVDFTLADTTYWFAPGTHTIGTGQFDQIGAGTGSVFTGAPGAVLDGQGDNKFAFGGTSSDVTVEYLTIENFIPPGSQGAVNANAEPGWTEEYNTMENILPGAATMAGTNAVIDDNCLTENGEYGFNAFTSNDDSTLTGGASNVTIDNNEISYNNTCNWEDVPSGYFPITPPAGCAGAGQYMGCGCSGGGKFWANDTGQFDDNYVHGNYSTGAWWDTDNAGWQIQDNYFSGNWGSGITYEISYNALISGNTFVDNAWGAGIYNTGFPETAVYISESGSDSRVAGPDGDTFDITDNGFYDNWGGVVLWENSDRFCGQLSPTGDSACTLVNPQWTFENRSVCGNQQPVPPSRDISAPVPPARKGRGTAGTSGGQNFTYLINRQPYYSDCRWKTRNVSVSANFFDFTAGNIPSCTLANNCGLNGVFSEVGVTPPYTGNVIENAITYDQDNLFSGNTYCGPWMFDPYQQGYQEDFAVWQAAPYNQDAGSTLNGQACVTPVAARNYWPNPVNRTITVPIRAGGGSR